MTDHPEDAGRLIAASLAKARPDAALRELSHRFRTDGAFRGTVEAFARGLGLRILGTLEGSLVLAADGDSPFAFRLADWRQNLSAEDKLCHGLIHLAIAAWCFPTAAALDDDDREMVAMGVQELVDYLRLACETLQKRATEDPEVARPELQEAWRVVLARPETRDTTDGRRAALPLSGMVGWALERLEKEGMLRKAGEGRYLSRPVFRIQVRELAAHEAFRLFRSIPRQEG